MTEPRKLTAGDLFVAALEVHRNERVQWLAANCTDPALRAEVDSLLAAHADAGDFLASPVIDTDAFEDEIVPVEDLSGCRVGAYRLVRILGRGGMSSVYLGERVEGDFAQQVAVKMIRRGMDSGPILRRFHTERQVLASLEHPHIARLIDGGATPDGRPFVVMEYVAGLPIDRYCAERNLSVPARLELFRDVCVAVQHAHGRLVVHRDLKPNNILINEDGQVKLLDFGIAKVLQPDAGGVADGLTATIQRVMTPRYASPEQVRGEPVTTATDIYSLGVLLYELLTSKPPYELSRTSSHEMEQVICATQPVRPSAAVTRGSRLARDLVGDLDNIVIKALRKEPDRRYASAEHFADDLRRYRDGHPVQARPDTVGYRTTKFVRRNLVPVLAAAVVMVTLVTATVVSTRLYLRSERALVEANTQRRTAAQVSDFLQNMMVAVDPVAMQSGEPVTVDQILGEAAGRLDDELAGEPEVAAALHGTIANTYLNLGRLKEAERHGLAQLAIRQESPAADTAPLASAQLLLGRIWRHQGQSARADSLLLPTLATARASDNGTGALTADVLRELAKVRHDQGEYDQAKLLIREAITLRGDFAGDQDEALANDHNTLGLVLVDSGELAAAQTHLEEALRLMTASHNEDHTFIGQIQNNLGWALGKEGKWEEASVFIEQALERYEGVFAADHMNVLTARGNLARARQLAGAWDEAERLHREVVAGMRSRFGDRHEYVAHALNNLALMVEEKGEEPATAANLLQEAALIYRERVGDEHPWTAIALHNLARVLRQDGDLQGAERECRASLALRERVLRENHPDLARSELLLGQILMDRADAAAAEPHLTLALAIRRKALPEGHAATADSELQLGLCLVALNRKVEARPLLEHARAELEAAHGTDSAQVHRATEALAACR